MINKVGKNLLLLLLLTGLLMSADFAFASNTDGAIDSTYKYAWGENIGWINFGCDNCDVHITDSGLSGYALSENIGWIYLGDITNDGEGNLSGYAWSENAGWLKFNPTNGGVVINSSGEFTGSALGENIGWIIFGGDYVVKTDWRPQSARVCTSWTYSDWSSCSGGQQTRTIVSSFPAGCSGGSPVLSQSCSSGGGGGGLPPGAYNPPSPPSGGFSILIQDNAEYTNNRAVILKLNGGSNVKKMAISNTGDFTDASQEDYQIEREWDLCSKLGGLVKFSDCPDGVYKVYVKFYSQYGQPSQIVSDEIILDTTAPEIKITESKDYYGSAKDVVLIAKTEAKAMIILHWDKKYGLISADKQGKLTINLGRMSVGSYQLEMTPTDLAGNKGEKLTIGLTIKPAEEVPKAELEAEPEKPKKPIIEKVPEIFKPLIPEFLKPEEKEEEKPEKMIVISEETPLAMQGQWKLLSEESVRIFVLAPLPKEILKLAEKFPELGETLKKVGITKITDIEKLKTAKLTLPGLTQRVGLPTTKIEPGKFALPQGVPVAKLSPEIKQQIPTEIVFAKAGGELIDFNIALTVDKKGEPQQKIATISGKPLQLVVKPDKPVKSVKGYVVFKSKKPRPTSFQFPFNHLAASLIFANPVLAHPQEKPVRVEEKLVLLEFEYTDPDGDGIYTAEIQAPLVEGEYEIITVMDFEDPELGKKEIRLVTVVDPEGYIYATMPAGKLRIAGAIVSIYWLNPEVKQYEIWLAKEYQQENPQTTDDTGKYSFLVPPGTYYLRVEHPNYPVYQSETFVVKEGSGIHMNIELKTKYWWLKVIDWKIIVMIIFGALLLYNFYRDKIREKLLRKSKKL